ncbi:MAG: MotA/TolQ/ExbB proton channel family protein [Desulfarculus sp.]|nr:MotA/TolQ/ExbB proton channel family protein [Desulfarculus sp.]
MSHGFLDAIMALVATPAAQAAQAGPAASQPLAGTANVWQLVLSSGQVVQLVLVLLVLFSLVTWGIIISKYLAIRQARRQNRRFASLFWLASSLEQAQDAVKALAASPLAAVFHLGYAELARIARLRAAGLLQGVSQPGLMENLRRALSQGQAAERTRLARTVTFLATCANTAPFIGLFGTVWGIMDAFRAIGAAGSANLATVAPGIAEALITTATGLFAAIPAAVFYNYFNRRLQVLDAGMESFRRHFLNLVELSQQGGVIPGPRAVAPDQLRPEA